MAVKKYKKLLFKMLDNNIKSVRQLAQILDVDESYMYIKLAGKRKFNLDDVVKIGKVLKLTPEEVVDIFLPELTQI